MLHGVNDSTLASYPPAALGRLVLANTIAEPDARLLTIDSDMIVNTSLRPLFELELGRHYFAAVHDPSRVDDPDYFNSGLTLSDVGAFCKHDLGRRSIRYVAEHRPYFADNDALNSLLAGDWHRLDPLWNFFRWPDGASVTPEDYDRAYVAHFPGWKPWDRADHPGCRLYNSYLDQYRTRLAEQRKFPARVRRAAERIVAHIASRIGTRPPGQPATPA